MKQLLKITSVYILMTVPARPGSTRTRRLELEDGTYLMTIILFKFQFFFVERTKELLRSTRLGPVRFGSAANSVRSYVQNSCLLFGSRKFFSFLLSRASSVLLLSTQQNHVEPDRAWTEESPHSVV